MEKRNLIMYKTKVKNSLYRVAHYAPSYVISSNYSSIKTLLE